MSHAPSPLATDGEAANPGPRIRRRGPRSMAAREKRRERRHGAEASVHDMTDLFKTEVTMLLVNIRSLLKNSAELQATVRLMHQKPDIIFLNETWLDRSVAEIPLEGYVCVARTDRRNGQKCGGVATYARDAIAPHTALAHESAVAERHWVILHSNQGPFLLANWYRPPCAGETASIQSLKTEWDALKDWRWGLS